MPWRKFFWILYHPDNFNCSLRAQLGSDDGSESKPSLCPQEFYSILKNKIN